VLDLLSHGIPDFGCTKVAKTLMWQCRLLCHYPFAICTGAIELGLINLHIF